jgi:hypothetical protein
MANEKFKVKFGLAVGDTSATIDGTTGNIITAGTLDVQGGTITDSTGALSITTGAGNGNITLTPNGTGDVILDSDTVQIESRLTTIGANNLILNTNDGTNSGQIQITQGAASNILITPNTTGDVYLESDTVYVGDNGAAATISTYGNAGLTITNGSGSDNILIDPASGTAAIDGNLILGRLNTAAILTTNGTGNLDIRTGSWPTSANITLADGANGNITVTPHGTGEVMVTSGVQSAKSFGAGNAAVGSSGEVGTVATFDATGATSGAVMQLGVRSENVTAGFAVTTNVIDHGENRPSGTATTSGNPSMFMESTRGTAAIPTATGSGDNIGALSFGGHDGVRGLVSQVNGGSVQLVGLAGQAFANSGGFTTQAGATTILRSQPNNLRLTSASRQNLFLANYTGGTTNTPPTQNLVFNSSTMSTQYDTAGNSINGHGRQDITFYHPTISIFGVPAESTANADNSTLPGSNVLTFFSSRQSGWSGRRDIVQSGDTLAQIRVFGQTTDNSTGTGSQTGTIEFDAAELFSATRRGSVFKIQTGEIGTNTLSNRLSLDSDNTAFSTTKTRFVTPGTANYGGEISQKVGILNGSTSYDKTTELSVTALTIDGTSNATYETKTLRSTDGVNYTPTQNNDVLGRFTFLGNYATGTAPLVSNAAGNISVSATEAWTASASGAAMKFNVNKTGTNTNISVLDLAAAASTFRSDSFTLQNSSSTNITGNNINYNRVYGAFQYDSTVTAASANTAYVFPIGTVDFANIISVGSTSRIIIGAAGIYNLQFSVQVENTTNSAEHTAYIWLRKNGTDVTASMGRVTMAKSAQAIASWNYVISSNNATDYYELAYAVDNTAVQFPAFAATAFGPSTASLITTVTPVGA